MDFQQYNFRWHDESTVQIQAHHKGRFARRNMQIGDDFTLHIVSDVSCCGVLNDSGFSPCPSGKPGKSKCEDCRAREQKESFVFTVFDGFNQEHLSSDDLQMISGPHVVYCAFFDDGMMKVGVSKKERMTLRQLEQGAYATLYVAETSDGIRARQIETTIRKNGLQDKVLASQKKDCIDPGFSETQTKEKLESEWNRHCDVLLQSGVFRSCIHEKPIFQSWRSHYNLDALQKDSKPLHAVTLKKNEWVSGKIIVKRGAFLVLDTGEEHILLHMKSYNGYGIRCTPKPFGVQLGTALQNSLF